MHGEALQRLSPTADRDGAVDGKPIPRPARATASPATNGHLNLPGGIVSADPPPYVVDPDELDNDQHPCAAWTVGEHLDDATAARLRNIIDNGNA